MFGDIVEFDKLTGWAADGHGGTWCMGAAVSEWRPLKPIFPSIQGI